MSYFIYARKSRKDAELEALGIDVLERHITTLLELAKTLSLPIGAIYREVVSGDSIDTRPVMTQVLSEVEACMWDGALVMDVDRLARGDTIDQGRVQRAFFYSNTRIVTPSKTYDPANEYDNEYFEFSLFMSRREYATIKRGCSAAGSVPVLMVIMLAMLPLWMGACHCTGWKTLFSYSQPNRGAGS